MGKMKRSIALLVVLSAALVASADATSAIAHSGTLSGRTPILTQAATSPYAPEEFAIVTDTGKTPASLDVYGDWLIYQPTAFGGGVGCIIKNLVSGTTIVGSSESMPGMMALWDGKVVWALGYKPSTIEEYDIDSGERRTVVESANEISAVDRWGDILIWKEYDSNLSQSRLKARNLATGQDYTIAEGPEYRLNPHIWGDVVVWEQATIAGQQRDIYGYRFSAGETFAISANPWDEFEPVISGDIVVWTDNRTGTTDGADIYGKNLASGAESAICTASGSQINPAIWGNIVVWEDGRDAMNLSGTDIYGYDLNRKQEFAITRHIGSQEEPAIYEKTVVWQDWRNAPWLKYSTGDMYGARLLEQPGPSPLPVTGVPAAFDGLIEVVWPHSGKPGTDTEKVNIGAYLFTPQGSKREVPCAFNPPLQLWMAINNRPAEMVAEIAYRTWNIAPATWHFNDVDVSIARNPDYRLSFFLRAPGDYSFRTNIWAHAADARTFFPQQMPVTAALGQVPNSVDAVIQIVWPHDNKPVAEATLVNISANLFDHGTSISVPGSWSPPVTLYRSLNNGVGEAVATGKKRLVTDGTLVYPVWDFNDIDVSAARDPINKYYFWIEVEGVETHPTIWAHGADARTYFPTADEPECFCNKCASE